MRTSIHRVQLSCTLPSSPHVARRQQQLQLVIHINIYDTCSIQDVSKDQDQDQGSNPSCRKSYIFASPFMQIERFVILKQSSKMPTAVVTGANSGIAHAFAKILVDEVSTFVPLFNTYLI